MQPRPVHAWSLGAIVLALAIGLMVWCHPSRRLDSAPRLATSDRLSEVARSALRTQMRTHALWMPSLLSNATLLDFDGVAGDAAALLAEPRIARPLGHDASELNSQLPERFFALQDQLRTDLGAVERAARSRDGAALADAFAATTRDCIHCHDAYLNGR